MAFRKPPAILPKTSVTQVVKQLNLPKDVTSLAIKILDPESDEAYEITARETEERVDQILANGNFQKEEPWLSPRLAPNPTS